MISEQNFGRPEDKDIEKQFMKKIRGDKLQSINAECELQICLAFKYHKNKDNIKNKRSKKKKEVEEDTQAIQNLLSALFIPQIDVMRRIQLQDAFKQLKQEWKFEQIQQGQQLPEYFFDDGCDLSYILYNILKRPQQNQKFSASELLLLQFLCLEGRKLLNAQIIQYYKQKIDFMILAMKNGLMKIEQKLKTIRSQGIAKNKQRKISNQQMQSSYNVQVLDQRDADKKQRKTKKIQKKKKNLKKGAKTKEVVSQDLQDQQRNSSQQDSYPDGTELALKTCNYISWAYWYIIKKE